jgi:hypothetical protein
MYNNVSRKITRAGNQIFQAKSTLLDDCFFQPELQEYSMMVLDPTRKALAKAVPELSEKFNTSKLYFGYSVGEDEDKDKAYIYVQKKNLVIDLHIKPSYVNKLEQEGFVIKQRDNFQSRAGWLTGWYVPHSTKNINIVVKYLSKAFWRQHYASKEKDE